MVEWGRGETAKKKNSRIAGLHELQARKRKKKKERRKKLFDCLKEWDITG